MLCKTHNRAKRKQIKLHKTMRKVLPVIIGMLFLSTMLQAKQTYIPRYASVVAIANHGDTIFEENKKSELVATAHNGLFRVGVVHEVLTVKRIRQIKRDNVSTALFALSGVMYGASSFSSDRIAQIHGQVGTVAAFTLAEMSAYNAKRDKVLGMEVVIENLSQEELMVNDTERGLVWFIQPQSSLTFPANNPDIIQLRVSDLHQEKIYFVQAGGGSTLKSTEVEWENDDVWVFPNYLTDGSEDEMNYWVTDKATGDSQKVTKAELKEIKKQSKKNQ